MRSKFMQAGALFLVFATAAFQCDPRGGIPSTVKLPLTAAQCPEGSSIPDSALPEGGRHDLVPYAPDLQLDYWSVRTGPARPVIVYIHGGGWDDAGGASLLSCKNALWAVNQVARGYNVVSVVYTPAPDIVTATQNGDSSNVIRSVRDIHLAIRTIRYYAASFNSDPTNINLAGVSAGGHLASLAALTADEPYYEHLNALPISDSVRSVMTVAGISNITTYTSGWGIEGAALVPRKFGCYPSSVASWRPCGSNVESSVNVPMRVTTSSPRFLMIHALDDGAVPYSQMQELANAVYAKARFATGIYSIISTLDGVPLTGHNLEPRFIGSPQLNAQIDCAFKGVC